MVEGKQDQLRTAFDAAGKKPNVGKYCGRFGRRDELPLEEIGRMVAEIRVDDFILVYEQNRRR